MNASPNPYKFNLCECNVGYILSQTSTNYPVCVCNTSIQNNYTLGYQNNDIFVCGSECGLN